MNYVFIAAEAMFGLVLMAAMNSKPVPVHTPVNVYVDCCDVGLNRTEKEDCAFAAESQDHTLIKRNGDTKTYVWSSCEIGKEPWRKFDK